MCSDPISADPICPFPILDDYYYYYYFYYHYYYYYYYYPYYYYYHYYYYYYRYDCYYYSYPICPFPRSAGPPCGRRGAARPGAQRVSFLERYISDYIYIYIHIYIYIYMYQELPFLAGYSLGRICHIVCRV